MKIENDDLQFTRQVALELSGGEQLVAETSAEVLESIPPVLARNTGMNPIDTTTHLRASQSTGEKHTDGYVINGIISNIEKIDVLEPIKVKEQVIKPATETANMILRIDGLAAVSSSSTEH